MASALVKLHYMHAVLSGLSKEDPQLPLPLGEKRAFPTPRPAQTPLESHRLGTCLPHNLYEGRGRAGVRGRVWRVKGVTRPRPVLLKGLLSHTPGSAVSAAEDEDGVLEPGCGPRPVGLAGFHRALH